VPRLQTALLGQTIWSMKGIYEQLNCGKLKFGGLNEKGL
jgi:hypothetical protein